MNRILLLLTAALCMHISHSQEYVDGTYTWSSSISEDIGTQTLPLETDSILQIRDQGDLMDFSGGYHEGDIVADFTAFNKDGEEFSLSSLLEDSSLSGKYTVLISGSNSCNRFTNFFNANSTNYSESHQFIGSHLEDFNWIMVYGYEAHPIDTENCLSNCPSAAVSGPAGFGEFQHQTYAERLDAVSRWAGVQDGSIETPETIATYAHGSSEPTGEQFQNYTPLGFNIPVYADNIDNMVYDTFFKKPFGVLVIDCSGIIVAQGDWFNNWLNEENPTSGLDFLTSLLEDDEELSCHEWTDFCNELSTDTDLDGLCDEWETQNNTNYDDICSPFGDDSDFDGLCDLLEENLLLDPFNPDSDNDLLSDGEEIALGTDPLDPDSDADGVEDGEEIREGSDPLNAESFMFLSEQEPELDFTLLKDPLSGNIKVELGIDGTFSITLSSTDGKELISDNFSSNKYIINPSNLSVGAYILRVQDSRGRIKTQRIFIE